MKKREIKSDEGKSNHMKNIEMVMELKKLLEPLGIEHYFDEGYGLFRVLGCLYNQPFYKAEYKTIRRTYSCQDVVNATKLSVEYLKGFDFTKCQDEKHIVNTILKPIARNLPYVCSDYDINELNDVLEMEM